MKILRRDEKLIHLKRPHSIYLVGNIAVILLLSIPVTIATLLAGLFFNKIAIALFLLLMILFALWQLVALFYLIYRSTCLVITNQRILYIRPSSLFKNSLTTINYDKIEDIVVTLNGVAQTYLNYGDIQIETAGSFKRLLFKGISDPYKTKELIFEIQRGLVK